MISLEGTQQAIAEEVANGISNFERMLVDELCRIGEDATNKARNIVSAGGGSMVAKTYTVQTSNLVSSTGYAVAKDGVVINIGDFTPVGGPKGDGKEGSENGKKFARQTVAQVPRGYALILVAGMDYASILQEQKHYDVLLSASLVAESELEKLKTTL